MALTRGFRGRGRDSRDPRLPPGQYDIGAEWPVLSAEPTPRLDPAGWSLSVEGLVDRPITLSWDQLRGLPPSAYNGDIHCVTTWSRLGVSFAGVSVDTVLDLAGVRPEATHVLAGSRTGYSANLPLADMRDGRSWLAWEADGAPLSAEHGGPVRLVVPHLYFWKSVKWVTWLRLLDHDEPGFWERNGYHDRGDPWREQRYQGD